MIKMNCRVMVVGKTAAQGKNGEMYYSLAVVVDGQAGNINCPKAVWENCPTMKEVELSCGYDIQWKNFRILGFIKAM